MNEIRTKYPQPILKQIKYPVTVFLCTPRCGTQWIAKNLNENYGDQVIACHEPVNNEYHPKNNLGRYEEPADQPENPRLSEHFDFINETVQGKNYIEVGWQSIAGIDGFHKRFKERMKLIHLYRNPVKVAASLVTHHWYTGDDKDRYEKGELTPFDDSALLKEYCERWANLPLFEKSLYYWTEINLRALEIKQRYSTVPFYSLQFEDLFNANEEKSRITLIELLAFMGLDYNKKMLEALDTNFDKYRYRSNVTINWEKIYNHPQTLTLANKLGYNFDKEIDVSRYERDPFYKRAIRRIKSTISNVFGRD